MKEILRLFKALKIVKKNKRVIPRKLFEETIKRGFIFSPEIISNYSEDELFKIVKIIEKEIGLTPEQFNNSFHKSWKKIKETNIEQLISEQLIHYFTTYGFEELGIYNEDSVYIPKEKLEIPNIKEDIKLVIIKGYTQEELKEKLMAMLKSGVAFKEDTIKDIIKVSLYFGMTEEEIELVKNKEAKAALYDKFDLFPKSAIEFLRFLIYKTTGSFLIIKDNKTITQLKDSGNISISLLTKYEKKYGLIPLAEIFNRFKPLFLALKGTDRKNEIINKISKLSKKYHKPMNEDLLNCITSKLKNKEKINFIELEKELENANTFRKIRLAYALNYRTNNVDSIMYKIRNGKSYAKEFSFKNKTKLTEIYNIVMDSIIKDVSKNVDGKKIYFPKNIVYSLPATEKQFTGDLPSGSYIKIDKDVIIGVHWENVDGNRIDLDLALIDKNQKFGWNGNYRNSDSTILFSGDMTSAPLPKGASEMFYISKQMKEEQSFLVTVNYFNFSDSVKVPMKIFVAKEKINDLNSNYMIDPNNILATAKTTIEQRQKVLGLLVCGVEETKFYFSESYLGNSISSHGNDYVDKSKNYLFNFYENTIKLEDVLLQAGAIIVSDPKEADIDLSIETLEKDKIIQLLY